jgi:hypothetical protein
MGKFPFKRPRIISKKFPGIDSHIDGVTKSLEGLVFSYREKVEKALQKKHIMMAVSSMALLIVLGSFISPKGKAESSIFYPESCLGGWINPDLAEGELETTSNGDESQFTAKNSAVLPKNTNAEMYCGSFKGTFNAATRPTKIIVSLALTKGSDTLPEELLYEASSSLLLSNDASSTEALASSTRSLASSTLLRATSSEAVDGTSAISSSTEHGSATSTEVVISSVEQTVSSSSPSIVEGIVETFKNTLIDLFERSGATVPETDTVVVPVPSQEESVPPVSFMGTLKGDIVTYLISSVFAEESTTSQSVLSEIIISTTTLETIFATSSFATSTDTGSSSEATSSVFLLESDSATTSNQFQNNFLEVFYTLDGVTWISLGELNEISMKYRTFEIPVTASTSWDDMSHLQMKVVARVGTVETPTIYLDGIKVEVLYDTDTVHVHPDFARDTILKDEIIDGMRIVTIINNDTNVQEIWYMSLEFVTATSSDFLATSTLSTSLSSQEGSSSVLLLTAATSSNEEDTSLIKSTTTKIIPLANLLKNGWKKYIGENISLSTTDLVVEIKKQEEAEKAEEIAMIPDFASDTIKRIKGTFLQAVIVQVEKKNNDELWRYNIEDNTQERLMVGSTTSVSSTYPLGVKGGFLFWLSVDKHKLYSYNFISKAVFEKDVPVFDGSFGERAEISFTEVPWKVIIGSEGFSFFSPETGEVFSDDNLNIAQAFRKKLKLDTVLDVEELSNLNFPEEATGTGQ